MAILKELIRGLSRPCRRTVPGARASIGGHRQRGVRRWVVLASLAAGLMTVPASADAEPAGEAGALTAARERVATAPQDPQAHIALGHIYYNRDQLDLALRCFERAVALDPQNIEALVNVGVLQFERGHAAQALPVLMSARELAPRDELLLCNLARVHVAMGETSQAVDCLVAALEVAPQSQPAHFQLGVLFAEAGIYAEAVREFTSVVDADPESPAADQARANLSRLRRLIDQERH